MSGKPRPRREKGQPGQPWVMKTREAGLWLILHPPRSEETSRDRWRGDPGRVGLPDWLQHPACQRTGSQPHLHTWFLRTVPSGQKSERGRPPRSSPSGLGSQRHGSRPRGGALSPSSDLPSHRGGSSGKSEGPTVGIKRGCPAQAAALVPSRQTYLQASTPPVDIPLQPTCILSRGKEGCWQEPSNPAASQNPVFKCHQS